METRPVDWLTILAVIGPIVGAIIGYFGSWFQQWYSQKHADKTRFHRLRVEIYSKYLEIANIIFLGFSEGKLPTNNLNNLTNLGAQVSLIASEGVRSPLSKLNDVIEKMHRDPTNFKKYTDEYGKQLRNVIVAARKEIGAKD